MPGIRMLTVQGTFAADPAGEALRQFGSNGVPYIASYLRTGAAESQFYIRVLTNLPISLQSRLPSPIERRMRRHAAAKAIAALGEQAESAGPILLAELRRSEVGFQEDLIQALWGIGVEPRLITEVVIELGQKRQYAKMVSIAGRAGWNNEAAVAKLLGEALAEQDPEVRTRALRLLEQAGPHASPALPRITSSVAHEDPETRYLAVRALRAIGTNTPAVGDALRSRLNEDDKLVRGASQRALLQLGSTPNAPNH